MGRFEQIALQVSALPLEKQDFIADLIAQALDEDLSHFSVLSDEQAEIVRQRISKPFCSNRATDEAVAAVLAPIHD